MVSSRAGSGGVARASAHRASSGHISLLREGDDVWSWFPAAETTSQAAVQREQEAAQTLLVPMARRDLGEISESAAFLNKEALWLSLVSRGELQDRKSVV